MSLLLRKLLPFGIVLLILTAIFAWLSHGNPSDRSIDATTGKDPLLVEAESERFPSLGLAETVVWKSGEGPAVPAGLTVSRFAAGLDHPRTMLTLPNGDVLVAETNAPKRESGGITDFFMGLFMSKVGANDPSPNRIILLRDGDGDGKAEQRFTFRTAGMASPSGMAWGAGKLYIANHNAVLAFDFAPGATTLIGNSKQLMALPGGGNHWMRNLLLSPDGAKLYVAVGSSSNIGENGMDKEAGRAAIWEIDIASGNRRQYAGGLRNPNGLGWNPSTGELWTVVNERDMLGPDLVPDYLTNVPVGAQYGWPWVYWKDIQDWRVKDPIPDFLTEYSRKPEYALGAHVAPLGLLFSAGGNLMGDGFANGAFVARHGSWNRKPLVGYDVVFVPFDAKGNPVGKVRPVLGGFLAKDGGDTRGRPVWLAWDKAGALLVSDDTGGAIWRVSAPGAKPSVAPVPVKSTPLPPQRELKGDPAAQYQGAFEQGDEGEYATVSGR
jgi:glucose/arabinose dehydrogenase